jgi:prophage maintenance system killer protein
MASGLFFLPAFLVMNGYNVAGDRQIESANDISAITAPEFHARAAQARRQPESR